MGWLGEEQSRCQERFEQFDDNVDEGDGGEDVNVVEYDGGGSGKLSQVRTPGRNRAGYVVFLAYQVTTIVIISVNLIPIIM